MWGEVELAWRLRDPEHPGAWLCVTGTNGKTTTVQMLDAILRAAGLRSVACGNVGLPIVEAVMDPEPYAVYAVELSSFQLHYTSSMSAHAAAVLNVAEDHLDWYVGPTGWPTTPPTRAGSTTGVQRACVYNVADPVTEQLVRDADVVEGARAIGFTLGTPGRRAWSAWSRTCWPTGPSSRSGEHVRRGAVHARPTSPRPAPHFVANALAAAALARSVGVPPSAVRDGLRAFRPTATGSPRSPRSTRCATSTTPRPPTRTPPPRRCRPTTRSCGSPAGWPRAPRSTTWSPACATGCGASCSSAADRAVIAEALSRHAPDVPVIEVDGGDTSVMDRVVGAAAELAQPGDTVLLAPGCASMDMFANYGARGDAFAESVRRLGGR